MNPEIKPFFQKYDGHFRYFGSVPQAELYKYYSEGSVFAICSIEDGLAMVQPQAMACGLPLLCTPNTGGEDLIEDGKEGFVIPIRNIDILKEKIQYLYENPEQCYEMGQAAKFKIKDRFSWDSYGENVVRQYESIISRRNRS